MPTLPTAHPAWLFKLRNALRALSAGADIILYGSRARGDFHANSDWDLLLISEVQTSPVALRALHAAVLDVELQENICVSLQVFSKKEWYSTQKITPFFKNIQRDGIVL